jgi:Xaa-Pro aminopeptidase
MLEDLDLLMEKEGIDALVAEGNGFETPDIYWLTGFLSPDNTIYFKNRGEDGIIVSYLNTIERVRKESFVTRTHDISDLVMQLYVKGERISNHPDLLYDNITKNLFSGGVIGVPDHLPASAVIALKELGIEIKLVPELLLDARATKSPKEIKAIKKAGFATTTAISEVVKMIKNASVGHNKVLWRKGEPLTVRHIKLALDHFLLDQRAESAEDAIVAVGRKGFDWHYLGRMNDKLKADTPIILDVFPRLKQERYIADVTRTVVKGKMTKRVQAMFDAVHAAANAAVDSLTAGNRIDDVNLACYKTLESHGFKSRQLHPETKDGMTHGLGHGIGLEVHENPSLYNREELLQEGQVLAIEPGVYLKAHGGVRIENDYVVTKRKAKLLTGGIDDILFV